MRQLLRKDTEFIWTDKQKQDLIRLNGNESTRCQIYDVKKDVTLSDDASSHPKYI